MDEHRALMRRAMHMAGTARMHSRPNPWVGAVLRCTDGSIFEGATQPPGGPHAEIVALEAARTAGVDTNGALLVTTLEPCSHTGRTGPCTDAIIAAGIGTVVSGVADPDPNVAGTGFDRLRAAGIEVIEGVCRDEVAEQLRPYLHHRRTNRPFVLLKMAVTIDARTSVPGGPRWITGEAARERVHVLRAESDAIVTGAGTVRTDDPELTVRHVEGPSPRRVVLSRGAIDPAARVNPCTVWNGGLGPLLDELGADGVIQVMVEAGPVVADAFRTEGLVDRWVFHMAPTVTGAEDAPGVFAGGAPHPLSLGRLVSVTALGDDIELVIDPIKETAA